MILNHLSMNILRRRLQPFDSEPTFSGRYPLAHDHLPIGLNLYVQGTFPKHPSATSPSSDARKKCTSAFLTTPRFFSVRPFTFRPLAAYFS